MGNDKAPTNFIDRTIAFFNPEVGVRRLAARQILTQFNYDGAYGSGKRSTGGGTLFRNASPESWAIQRDAIKLMWESRDMESNFCIYRGMLTRMVLYALGTIRWQSRTGDTAVDEAHEEYWEQWCHNADVTKRFHLYAMVRLGLRGMLRDRDYGFALSDDEAGNLQVKNIEADRIGNPLYVGQTDEKKIHGVLLDDDGAVEGFEIFKRTRTNQFEPEATLDTAHFLHLVDPLRYDQYRGIALFAPALPHMRDLYEAMEAEMQAIKFAGSFAAFVKSAVGYANVGASAFDRDKNVAGENKLSVKPGIIQRLTQGEDITFAQTPARPSGAFIAFFETKVREICNAGNVPYGFGWNLQDLGGVTARIEVAQMERTLNGLRELVRERVLDPLKDRVLRRGVAKGEIPGHPKRGTGRWGFGAAITGDVGHDTNADLALLNAGIYSESFLVEGKYGGDFREHVQQQAREINIRREVTTESGVPIELQTARLPNATQLLAAMNSRGDPDAEAQTLDENAPDEAPGQAQADPNLPPPGLAGTYGKDALKGVLEVMKQLNLGGITRDQAITTLVATYGMDLADAEAVVPK